jgi:hypothetical protein
MKAFIGHSFEEKDEQLIAKITDFIKALDIECVDAKPAKPKTVEEKITELIKGCDIFVGIFNCDKIICQEEGEVKWRCNPQNKTTIYTTSNWVIQESGFALGSNKYLILLQENGVCDLPKLQGNLEYIPFDRNHIEGSFIKISQMINDIKNKAISGATEKSSEGLSISEENKPEEQKEQPKTEVKDKKAELIRKVYFALGVDKDYKKAWEIFDKEAEATLNEDDRIWLHAYILKTSHSLGDESAFGKLEKLAQENKDKPRAIKQLAYRYKEIGEFKRARDKFLLAAEKYDINDADKIGGLVEAYIQAAWCLALDGVTDEAIGELKRLLSNPHLQEFRADIFEAMARISKDKGVLEDFFVYAEAALDNNPVNKQLRFDLAYAYGDNNAKLSLLHYRKLTDTTKHSTGLNNMGASYGNLELKGKSISSYFEAARENETIAMGNLAHAYIDAGFIVDAQNQIDKANKLSSEWTKVNPRVGDAQYKITTLLEKEKKKEEEILLEARKESQYRVKYSKALCSDVKMKKNQIDGEWQTSRGILKLIFDESLNAFETNIQLEAGKQNYLKGSISGMSGKYSIKSSGTPGITLLGGYTPNESTGYMIINDSCDCIEIMEKTKDGKTQFEQWKKKPVSTVESVT